MKFLVVGCGSIGKRHIKNLLILKHEVIGYDNHQDVLDQIKKELNIEVSDNFEASLKKVDAALICTPNHLHTKFAAAALKENKHILIEKPLADKLEGLEEIYQLSKKNNLVVYVGYNLRHHPLLKITKENLNAGKIGKIKEAFIEFGSYLPNWRPGQDYTKNYGAHKAMGGGIILDDIHEINYLVWFFGKIKKIKCLANKIGNLQIDTEDTADMVLESVSGVKINLHMDYLQKIPKRTFKIIGEKGSLIGDLNYNHDGSKFDYNLTYLEELKEFIECIEKNKKPSTSYEEGIYDLMIALAAKESSEKTTLVVL